MWPNYYQIELLLDPFFLNMVQWSLNGSHQSFSGLTLVHYKKEFGVFQLLSYRGWRGVASGPSGVVGFVCVVLVWWGCLMDGRMGEG